MYCIMNKYILHIFRLNSVRYSVVWCNLHSTHVHTYMRICIRMYICMYICMYIWVTLTSSGLVAFKLFTFAMFLFIPIPNVARPPSIPRGTTDTLTTAAYIHTYLHTYMTYIHYIHTLHTYIHIHYNYQCILENKNLHTHTYSTYTHTNKEYIHTYIHSYIHTNKHYITETL